MNHKPLQAYELNPCTLDDVTGYITTAIKAQVVDMADKAIVDAVVKAAQEAGITTLYLMDKTFVLDAIREKMERKELAERAKEETGWFSPDDPPSRSEYYTNLTENVLLRTSGGYRVGYYDYIAKVWRNYTDNQEKLEPGTVLGWKPLE